MASDAAGGRDASASAGEASRSESGGPEPAPLKRREKLQNTRAAILESALSHFARRGYEGASTRDIAESAGVRHGMIRHIYGTKDELWRQAISFLFERMHAEMAPSLAQFESGDGRAFWKAWVRWYIGYCSRHPEHARLMIQQSIMEGPQMEWAAQQFIRDRHNWYFPTIERMKAAGELPNVDTLSLFFMIGSACQMMYVLAPEIKAVDGRDVFDPIEIEKHIEAVTTVFLR
jgi:TetR/AcrR family transcriptional regulator